MKAETQLLRQIHPSFIRNGLPTSQAFRPTPKDANRLSVDNGERVSPAAAFMRFTATPGCISVGVQAVTAAECAARQLPVVEDATPYPEHCSIDFSALGKAAVRLEAQHLRDYAAARGWRYEA